MYKGFLKVLTVTPKLTVGNTKENVQEIIKVLKETKAQLVVFPELSLTGYTCGDLFYQDKLIKASLEGLSELLKIGYKGIAVVGMPIDINGVLYNTAVVFQDSKILGVTPKLYLPNTGEFYEKRWFNSALDIEFESITILGQEVPFGHILFEDINNEVTFGIEICQDMWVPITPGNLLALEGANMILNLSASNEYVEKATVRKSIVIEQSRKNHGAYLYTSSGIGESTSETLFSGHNIHACLGKLLKEDKFMKNKTEGLYSDIDFGHINFSRRKDTSLKDFLHKFNFRFKKVKVSFPDDDFYFSSPINQFPFTENFETIRSIQTGALYKRLEHLNLPKIILGLSGGLDSSLALMVAYDTFKMYNLDVKDIVCVSMPGLATTDRTRKNAFDLAKILGVTFKEIDIKEEVLRHFKSIGQDENTFDVTYENTQARLRTMTLMNLANKEGGIVLGTGNLSEIALGFMTYSGDMMSMYAINAGLPKTLVKTQLNAYVSLYPVIKGTVGNVLNTPISPELIQGQETEKIIGSYEQNDFLLYRHLVCGDEQEKLIYMLSSAFNLDKKNASKMVINFIKRFYNSQFKRQVMPDGPKIVTFSLSPRSDFRMPSDVKI